MRLSAAACLAVLACSQMAFASDWSANFWNSNDLPDPDRFKSVFAQYHDISNGSKYRRSGQPVGRIKILKGNKLEICTGFVLEGALVGTARHCVANSDSIDAIKIEFGYDHPGASVKTYELGTQPAYNNEHFDFVILRANEDLEALFGAVDVSDIMPSENEGFYIVHYPLGTPKALTLSDCSFAGEYEINFHFLHTCKTLKGSSGGPIFNAQSDEVVGFHHKAQPRRDDGKFDLTDSRGTFLAPVIVDAGLGQMNVDRRKLHRVQFLRRAPCEFDETNRWVSMVMSVLHKDGKDMLAATDKAIGDLRAAFPEVDFDPLPPFTENKAWGVLAASWVSKAEAENVTRRINRLNELLQKAGVSTPLANTAIILGDQKPIPDDRVGC